MPVARAEQLVNSAAAGRCVRAKLALLRGREDRQP